MRIGLFVAVVLLFVTPKVFAFGIDVGPVHVHGTKVKVGEHIDLKIVVDRIRFEESDKHKEKEKVIKIFGHRKGDSDDKFEIKVDEGDLDEGSVKTLRHVKEDKRYEMRLKKLDDDWKLDRIRKEDEDD